MRIAATTFAGDIYRSSSREEAAAASRTLLRAVARLLAVVDSVDLCKFQDTTSVVSELFVCDKRASLHVSDPACSWRRN